VAIGLNWKRATATAACTAIVASLVVNFSIKAFGISMPLSIDSGAVALLISIVLFISVSLLTPRPVASQIDAAKLKNQ
jgi:Na+/proline symporter